MMSNYDAWRTREPDYGPDPPFPGDESWPRCSCGAWLRLKADRVEDWEDATECDGTVEIVQYAYDESSIAVLGEEYRGKTYGVAVSACGAEIGKPHEPHREVNWAGATEYRTCRRCGHENASAEL
jgi:hypothetical protein